MSKYHQYEVTGDFNKIKSYIENCNDPSAVQEAINYMTKYDLSYEQLILQSGEIAPGFNSVGGGIQWQLPMPADLLEKLGLLKIVK